MRNTGDPDSHQESTRTMRRQSNVRSDGVSQYGRSCGIWRIAQVIFMQVFVVLYSLCGRCLAEDEVSLAVPTAAVDFQVMIHGELINDDNGEPTASQVAEQIAWRPCSDGVIYLSALRSWAPELKRWVGAFPKPAPRTIAFRGEDHRLVPRMALGRVGDRLHLWTGENGLQVVPFMARPGGLSGVRSYYTLREAEDIPILVMDDLRPNIRAYLLITDHGVAAVTDQQGRAHFPAIPVGIELPMRIVVPWLRQGPTFTSETLVFTQTRFSLKVEQGASVTHEIRVSVGPAGGDGSARTKAGTN